MNRRLLTALEKMTQVHLKQKAGPEHTLSLMDDGELAVHAEEQISAFAREATGKEDRLMLREARALLKEFKKAQQHTAPAAVWISMNTPSASHSRNRRTTDMESVVWR